MLDGLVDIDTPNGRVTMTRQQAEMLGMAQPPAPASPDDALAALGGMPPTDPQAPPPDMAPTFAPDRAAPAAPAPMPEQPVVVPAGVTHAAPLNEMPPPGPAAPPPAPAQAAPVAVDIAHLTANDVAQREQHDQQALGAANQGVSDLETQQLAAKAAHDEAGLAVQAKMQADADAKAKADQAELANKAKVWEAKSNEWLNAKVQRRSMSGMETLGAILSGLGNVVNKSSGPNQAIAFAMNKIEQDVADQERARARLGEVADHLKGSLDYAREMATTSSAQRIAAIGLEAKRQAGEWDVIAGKMAPGQKQAQTKAAAAQLAIEGDKMLRTAFEHNATQDMEQKKFAEQVASRQASNANAAAGRAQAAEFHKDEVALRMMDHEDAKAARSAAATSAADAEAAKREIPDIFTEAKGVDGKSVQQPYRARNEKVGDKIVEIKAARDVIDANLQEALRIRQNYPSMAAAQNSPEWQKLNSLVTNAGIAYGKLQQLGTYDAGTAEATNKVLGGNPLSGSFANDMISGLWSNKDPSAGLQKARELVNDKFNFEANAGRDPRGGAYVPLKLEQAVYAKPITTKNDEKVQALLNEKTPAEVRKAAEPGPIAGAMAGSNRLFGGETLATNAQTKAETAATLTQDATGRVTKNQAQAIGSYVDQLHAKDPALAADARKSLVALATNQSKPQLAQFAVDALVKAGDGPALAEIEKTLTRGATSEREIERRREPVSVSRGIAQASQASSVGDLATKARSGDIAARNQLVEIAMAAGDPRSLDAQAVLSMMRRQ